MRSTILLLLFTCFCLFFSCQNDSNSPDTNDISLKWHLIKNYQENDREVHEAVFSITNKSDFPLKDNWALYWNQSPRGIIRIDSSKQVNVQQINGDYYSLKPETGFELAPNTSVHIQVISDVWMIKESDGPLGVYAVFNPGDQETIKIIDDYSVVPFTDSVQVTRGKFDQFPIPTAAFLFDENAKMNLVESNQMYRSIPSPKFYSSQPGKLTITDGFTVATTPEAKREAELFIELMEARFGIKGTISNGETSTIIFSFNTGLPQTGAYILSVKNNQIEITGKDKAGVFYGTQTLMNLIEKDDSGYSIANCAIEDSPAFEYRGLHLDLARNFQSKESVLRLIDIMAAYKVNKLVMCLTEDEGWRLEIDGLPELTEVGAFRGHPKSDGSVLQPGYGSGPFSTNEIGSGFYTREEYKEMIRYGHERHVDLIPLINVPGHARAAIKAMEYRYKRLMKAGKPIEAEKFRLIDPDDESVYRSAQQYNDNILCACRQSSYDFYEFVVDDIIEMYEEAEVPLYMFHTGGDEVPRGAWMDSPLCKEYLKDQPEINTTPEVQAMFFNKITAMLKSKVERVGGWEEVVMSYDDDNQWYTNTDFTDRNVYPYIWNNIWGQQDLGIKIANRGYPIVICNVSNFYFDLAYDKDPREPGLYWAGFCDTQDAFDFIPDDMFKSSTKGAMGNTYDLEKDFDDMERMTPAGRQRMIGIQGQLWSETVKGRSMMEHYILPKLFGFAQRAWEGQPTWGNTENTADRTNQKNSDWNRFANTLSRRHFEQLDNWQGGYNYRIPTPGIKLIDGKVHMNSAYPGMEIRYTIDGSEPGTDSQVYEGPIDFSKGTVRAKVFNSKGRSGLSSTFTTDEAVKVLD